MHCPFDSCNYKCSIPGRMSFHISRFHCDFLKDNTGNMHCPFDSCDYETSMSVYMKCHISRFHKDECKDVKYCSFCREFELSDSQHEQTQNVCSVCKAATVTAQLPFQDG